MRSLTATTSAPSACSMILSAARPTRPRPLIAMLAMAPPLDVPARLAFLLHGHAGSLQLPCRRDRAAWRPETGCPGPELSAAAGFRAGRGAAHRVPQEQVGPVTAHGEQLGGLGPAGEQFPRSDQPGRAVSPRPASTGEMVRNSSSSGPSAASWPSSRGPPSVSTMLPPRARAAASTSADGSSGWSPRSRIVHAGGPAVKARGPAAVVRTSASARSAGCPAGMSRGR